MRKKLIFGIVLLTFTALIFNTNVNAISSMENVEALEYAASDTKLYCCSPYDKTCVTYGKHTTVMGTLRKNSPC
jgi:hypothetical protein